MADWDPMMTPLSRRAFLRGTGVSLSLPFLEAMTPTLARAAEAKVPNRMVAICTSLGVYGPAFFPSKPGREYEPTPYLEPLQDLRDRFTVLSGLSHPEQSGANGHTSEMTWLTTAKHPGLGGFRNTISIDQLVAERIGFETRLPSLVLGTGGSSQSYTRSGVMIPAETKPSKVFARLFLDGTPEEIQSQMRKLRQGRSIMDTVQDEASRIGKRVGSADREKLDEYFTSVREMEVRLEKAEEWVQRPKPKVAEKPLQDITNESDLIGRMRLLFQLVPLALQTDSTRLVTILISGRNDVPVVPGVTIDHHNLSHHGQDPGKIDQLKRIELAEFKALGDFLRELAGKSEGGGNLLDSTMVLYGSNLGNANSHSSTNLPLLLAGGGFKHGQHLVAGQETNNVPLANLFVQMLQQMGQEVDSFGSSSSSSVPGLES